MIPVNVRTQTARRSFNMMLGAAALSLVFALPAVASAQARISGHGISKVERDTRKLTVTAQSAGASANGTVAFIHNSPAGLTRFRGTVSCLNVSAGTVQVSGTIDKGETATGALLDGKAFAFTIATGTSPQRFSLPNFGDAGSIAPCSGGRSETVPVTEDGFSIQ